MSLVRFLSVFIVFILSLSFNHSVSAQQPIPETGNNAFTDAGAFGFSPEASGVENRLSLQRAIDQGGTIVVSRSGVYALAGTVYVGSNTTVVFGNGVVIKKIAMTEPFTHVLLNKGALTKTYDHNISIEGLQIMVNGVDKTFDQIYGLRGQIAFFYVKDLRIERFRCMDLTNMQFGIHVCTFEDLIIDDVIIKGKKDGIHLGRGKRFTIRNGVFQTYDDAIALNAHDYATSNPELGWIEDGVVENCHDLDAENTTGYFCRILGGAWVDWKPGMEVQQSDAVVSEGRVYRVQAQADGRKYKSVTQPTHQEGSKELDGIRWGVVQNEPVYTAGVRNVTFRNIFLSKARTAFSVHFDNDKYSRSYYPGATVPVQQQLTFDDVRVKHDGGSDFLSINTPMDVITISNCVFRNNGIRFHSNDAMKDYLLTRINMIGCIFDVNGSFNLVHNGVKEKQIILKTSSSVELQDDFSAAVISGNGTITVNSDLTGLK